MRELILRTTALVPMLLALTPGASAAGPALSNLVINGAFDRGPAGWGEASFKRKGVSVGMTNGNSWLVLDGSSASITQHVPLQPDWLVLRLSARMRVTGVVPDKEGWQDARLAMSFHDASGKRLDPWPNVIHASGTADWQRFDRTFRIPPGAARLSLNPAQFGASGRAEFDDIVITVAHAKGWPIPDLPRPPAAPDTDDLANAATRTSPTRAEICLNGLWRFLPAIGGAPETPPPPGSGWGWFKVPGVWPSSDNDPQQFLLAESFDDDAPKRFDQAWYRRAIAVPADWQGRRILLDFRMVQTHARVRIDDRDAGEIFFPGGRLDVTPLVRPGATHALAVLVTAKPLDAESNVFMAPERIVTSKATVKLKGLADDVMLLSEPPADAIDGLHVITSVRHGTIAIDAALAAIGAGTRVLAAEIRDAGKTVKSFESPPFDASALKDGRCMFSAPWPDAKRWDTGAPCLYEVVLALRDANGKILDRSLPVRFGFREFAINGRDFLLNGTPIHLRALHSGNINSGADLASIEGCRNTCRRLGQHGFNFLITGNYNFSPGEVSHMDSLFDACDESGILAAFSLPHVKDFAWKLDSPEQSARYRALCAWLVRRAQNHPSIVLYAMNHNATGYYGDQNPARMDGIYEPQFPPKPSSDPKKPPQPDSRARNRAQALLAADIAKSLDPTRPVYHHQSGSLGDLYTVNIYLNWAPIQERSDWLEHWAAAGKKPMFFVEWGLPHISSWSSFRGPAFIWRNEAFQQIWDSEFAAAYLGERAYAMTPAKTASMQWEEDLWAKGNPFHWSTLIRHLRSQDENYTEVQALFAADNWRSHRAWGISAMLPWDQENLWRKEPSCPARPVPAPERFRNLQSPGIVPDQIRPPEQFIYCRDDSAMRPSALGETFLRWNMPLCAFLGGGPDRFTEKSHVFRPGETARKQIVLLNDTRHETTCNFSWSLSDTGIGGKGSAKIPPGGKTTVPIALNLPPDLPAGRHTLAAAFAFADAPTQKDALAIDILPAPPVTPLRSRIALFDPQGLTAPLLKSHGANFKLVTAADSLAKFDLLVVGRQALSLDAPGPNLARVADGMNVLVFEQDADVLEGRFGFRVNIHGLRQVFPRAASHPALAGLAAEHLRDWRGAATLVRPHLDIAGLETSDPKWRWCGFENTRVWRCGNHGSVATVLIEKPERGDWLPLLDGGFDLQFSPLMECAHGKGRIVFCQLDVTARTDAEPAARNLCANLLRYLDTARPAPSRAVVYSGQPPGSDLLAKLGLTPEPFVAERMPPDALLVLGPGHQARALDAAVSNGMQVLCLGLDASDLRSAFNEGIKTSDGPAVSGLLSATDPEFLGISSAELHWRTRPAIASLAGAAAGINPSLAVLPRGKGRLVLCQSAPWMFDFEKKPYLRTTHRRSVFLASRLLANLGARTHCPVIDRFAKKPDADKPWLGALYLQDPVAEDDPYRYYRW